MRRLIEGFTLNKVMRVEKRTALELETMMLEVGVQLWDVSQLLCKFFTLLLLQTMNPAL